MWFWVFDFNATWCTKIITVDIKHFLYYPPRIPFDPFAFHNSSRDHSYLLLRVRTFCLICVSSRLFYRERDAIRRNPQAVRDDNFCFEIISDTIFLILTGAGSEFPSNSRRLSRNFGNILHNASSCAKGSIQVHFDVIFYLVQFHKRFKKVTEQTWLDSKVTETLEDPKKIYYCLKNGKFWSNLQKLKKYQIFIWRLTNYSLSQQLFHLINVLYWFDLWKFPLIIIIFWTNINHLPIPVPFFTQYYLNHFLFTQPYHWIASFFTQQ